MTVPTDTAFDFETPLAHRAADGFKWTLYEPDVLPMWIADMDFRSPDCVAQALARRATEHGAFGYQFDSPALRSTLQQRMKTLYHWDIDTADIVFLPSLVVGLNLMCKLYGGEAGSGVLTFAPIYPPFLSAPKNHGQHAVQVEMTVRKDGQRLHYDIDLAALEAAITPQTRLLMLCNPHNPTGRMFTRAELEGLAELAERHDLTIVSDEIHCDLLLDSAQPHIPMASLSAQTAARTITLMAPSKTFNVPGLGLGFAIIQNEEYRKALYGEMWSGTVAHPNVMGYVGAQAAYQDGQAWLSAALAYLRANRDALVEYVERELPDVNISIPQATFLAWLDFRATPIADNPHKGLLERGRVALNNGADFGQGGAGFARLNFACSRAVLMDGLARIKQALNEV